MSSQPYATAPTATAGMPPGIPFIVGNEAAERFSYYWMRAILVVFMTKYLMNAQGQLDPMTEAEATVDEAAGAEASEESAEEPAEVK